MIYKKRIIQISIVVLSLLIVLEFYYQWQFKIFENHFIIKQSFYDLIEYENKISTFQITLDKNILLSDNNNTNNNNTNNNVNNIDKNINPSNTRWSHFKKVMYIEDFNPPILEEFNPPE
jgi:hypothetical protein